MLLLTIPHRSVLPRVSVNTVHLSTCDSFRLLDETVVANAVIAGAPYAVRFVRLAPIAGNVVRSYGPKGHKSIWVQT
jgi:hypothetical protein